MCHVEKSPVADYLSRLSASDRAELEAKAILQARGLPATGYRRATAAGNHDRAEHYRQVMLEQYLTQVIKADPAIAGGHVTQTSN